MFKLYKVMLKISFSCQLRNGRADPVILASSVCSAGHCEALHVFSLFSFLESLISLSVLLTPPGNSGAKNAVTV